MTHIFNLLRAAKAMTIGFIVGCTYGAVLAAGGQALVSLAKAVM